MSTRIPVIAVFDIGKTNKKILVFDQSYKVVKELAMQFEEKEDDDGFPAEDLVQLSAWIKSSFQELQALPSVELRAVNFSAYGASLVHLNLSGEQIGQLYNYLKPYPQELLAEFGRLYASNDTLLIETCSPLMGHLNAGLQLYWLKKNKTDLFDNIGSSLHFPQYLSYLLTGKKFAEMTNVGCHSVMWDFKRMRYHDWLWKEDIEMRLAVITPGSHTVPVPSSREGTTIEIGIGLHDSSAALIPYLQCFTDPFMILSTGTWSISLNPFSNRLPNVEELSKGCLSYLTYDGQPVKTSMLFAGNDHDTQVKRIAEHFGVGEYFFKTCIPAKTLMELSWEQASAIDKACITGSPNRPCYFRERVLSEFSSTTSAYHQLLADLVYQQQQYTTMVLTDSDVRDIYVDGGFCKNELYMQYLANAFPAHQVYSATMVQGTALGAALAIHTRWNDQLLPENLLQLKRWYVLK